MRLLGWFLVFIGALAPSFVPELWLMPTLQLSGPAAAAGGAAPSVTFGIPYVGIASLSCLLLGIVLLIVDYRTWRRQTAESVDSPA